MHCLISHLLFGCLVLCTIFLRPLVKCHIVYTKDLYLIQIGITFHGILYCVSHKHKLFVSYQKAVSSIDQMIQLEIS